MPSSATAGPHTVSDKSSGSNLASATFTVTTTPVATISLNPTSGPTGTSVTVTGSNFVANSAITISYDNTAITTNPATVTTTSTGSFSATITIPASTAAPHTISATDASSNSASAQFTVTTTPVATISLNPTSGPTGTSVTVTGSNFVANSAITIKLDGTAITTGASGGSIQLDNTWKTSGAVSSS